MIAIGFVSSVIREKTIGQAVRCAMFKDTGATFPVVGAALLGANTFFYIFTGHAIPSLS